MRCYGYRSRSDIIKWILTHRSFTFLVGGAIGVIMALVAFQILTDLPDYAVGFGTLLLVLGVLITIIATPFIMFEMSQGRNAMLTGALGVGWGYSTIEFGMWFAKREPDAQTETAKFIISLLAFL